MTDGKSKMYPYSSFSVFLFCLQNTELFAAPSVFLLPEMEYLASNLTPEECYQFYSLLDHHREIGGATFVYGNRERKRIIPCVSLLVVWLTDPDELEYRTPKNIELRLRQIGRSDLAHWLDYRTVYRRQPDNIRADARNIEGVEELEDSRGGRIMQETFLEKNHDENDAVISTTNTNYSFWEMFLVISLVTLVVFACLYCCRYLFAKISCTCYRCKEKNCEEKDEECWLKEDIRKTSHPTCCTGERDQRKFCRINVDLSKWKNRSPFSFFSNRCKRFKNEDGRLQKNPSVEKKTKRSMSTFQQERTKLLAQEDKAPTKDLAKRLANIRLQSRNAFRFKQGERLKEKLNFRKFLINKDDQLLKTNQESMKKEITIPGSTKKLTSDDDSLGEKDLLKIINEKERGKLDASRLEQSSIPPVGRKKRPQRSKERKDEKENVDALQYKLNSNCDVEDRNLCHDKHSSPRSCSIDKTERLDPTSELVDYCNTFNFNEKAPLSGATQNQINKFDEYQPNFIEFSSKWSEPTPATSKYKLSSDFSFTGKERSCICEREKNVSSHSQADDPSPGDVTKPEIIFLEESIAQSKNEVDEDSVAQKTLRRLSAVEWTKTSTSLPIMNLKSSSISKDPSSRRKYLKATEEGMRLGRKLKIHSEYSDGGLMTQPVADRLDVNQKKVGDFAMKTVGFDKKNQSNGDKGRRIKSNEECRMNVTVVDSTTSARSKRDEKLRRSNTSKQVIQTQETLKKADADDTYSAFSGDFTDINTRSICQREKTCEENYPMTSFILNDTFIQVKLSKSNEKAQTEKILDYRTKQISVPISTKSTESPKSPSGDYNRAADRESYDELGMLLSDRMKREARPCRRKYCQVRRHLRRDSGVHDEQHCRIRHNCCRSRDCYRRVVYSGGMISTDTYEEFKSMKVLQGEKIARRTVYDRKYGL